MFYRTISVTGLHVEKLRNKYLQRSGPPNYLLFHDHAGDGGLDHVGAIQAVHAIDAENPFLFTYHPGLIDPFRK